MKLFRSRFEKELDSLIENIDINLQNNYKSVAHDYRRKLGERTEELYREGKLDGKQYGFYRLRFEEYSEKMKDYHH